MVCNQYNTGFQISDWEKEFLEKLSISSPTFCSACRHQQRLAWRNERSLYKSVCSKTGKSIISMYAPAKNLTVYASDVWWGDGWDARDYGSDFDFNRPFFEQFAELQKLVPKIPLFNLKGENSNYCNITEITKNCYLCFGSQNTKDSYYSTFDFNSKNSCDVYWVDHSELLYECIDCNRCFNVQHAQYSQGCNDSAFLFDCRNCEKCLACVGLREKKYHILNQSYSKEVYEQKIKEYALNTRSGRERMKQEFQKFRLKFPHRGAWIVNSEECTGNNIVQGKNCVNCFDVDGPARDFKDTIIAGLNSKDAISCDHIGVSEIQYENMSSVWSNTCAFSMYLRSSNNIWYSESINNSDHLFGCTQMKRAKYCILNKQYSKEDYFNLKSRSDPFGIFNH
ncbi:hypothetical protein HZA43_00980 [Candidatus Peregrinibacteria bacterium]|nr:hypothetical protein [Candidatus Peregrinibacteria bacterium]